MAVDSLLSHMTTSTTGMRIAWLLEDFAQSAADHWNEPIGEVAITLPRLSECTKYVNDNNVNNKNSSYQSYTIAAVNGKIYQKCIFQ